MEARLASALVDDIVEARVGVQTGELARRVFPQAALMRCAIGGPRQGRLGLLVVEPTLTMIAALAGCAWLAWS